MTRILLNHLVLPLLLVTFSVNASALVWGQSNWGESNWGADATHGPVTPPEGPVPVSPKVRALNGAVTDAGFSAGAYSDSGEPVYGNRFTAGDFITMLAEVRPDSIDIGKNGELFVIMLSLINTKQVWSFLNEDGNFESWDLNMAHLGPAAVVEPLEDVHTITIFEGTLQAGAHRVAVGYMATGRPMIYTAKAISIIVDE